MSHSFYVALDEPPTYEAVLGGFTPRLQTAAGLTEDLEGPWQEGHVLAVWRDGVSTRPIELCWERGKLSARILACSCAEDYGIGLDAVCGAARAAGREVESEEGIRFTDAEREATHGADWIARHVDSMVTSVIAHARSLDEGYITMPGPTRDFHLGPRVLAEIGDGDVAAQREALFTKMRALFYPDPEEVYPANVLSVTRDDGSRVTLTAFARDVSYIFPPVELLTVLDDEPFEIPFEALGAVVGEDRIVWMDEVCPAVEAIGPTEWPAVVALARAHAVDTMSRRPSTPADRISHAPTPPVGSGGVPWGLVIGVLIAFAVVAYVLSR